MNRHSIQLLGMFLLAALLAQVDPANLTGTVSDPSGSVIPGAVVEDIFRETGTKRTAQERTFASLAAESRNIAPLLSSGRSIQQMSS